MRNHVSLAVTVLGIAQVNGYPSFQNNIPNGNRIADCDGRIWPGVGHLARAGDGPRNPFGRDFESAGTTWTVALCRKDSDGDGLTNGEELGDPNCLWTRSNNQGLMEPLSHPGIVCENVKGNQTNTNDTDSDGENPTDEFYYFPTSQWAHGMLMLVAWVVLAPIGILFSLCNKTKVPPPVKSWFKFHQAIMFTVLILTLIAFIVIVNDLGDLDFDENHNAVGFTVVVFSVIQFFGGVFRIHHKPHHAPKSTVRLVWEYCHQWFGRSTFVLAIAAAVMGLEILGLRLNVTHVTDGIRYTIIAILIASSLAAIIYVLLFRRDEREYKHTKDPQGEKKETKAVHEDVQAEGDVTKF